MMRIAGGDERAFGVIVNRHARKAHAIAFRILNNSADAEDVVQDILTRIWTRRGQWQPGRSKFTTWLYRVVMNGCIDFLRKPKFNTMDKLPDVEDVCPDQMQQMARQQAAEMLNRAVEQLPEQQRVAVLLSYNETLTNPEIALVMETTVMAVESLLKRGRQRLREILARQNETVSPLLNDG
ncbi:sigma-70 family RNA polymerase sigma factor [Roseibium sp. RKSG952]|uniref:sigma-70 family RNA polymerase sigma factor n=1 Tax=Roseibium sp. RKSG952 TaxID=2529384 RepID=UPI001FCC6C69|nr:sigma-70 family RNA polymerase sigma factor [Roseibium sp. RKSG952]